MGNAGAERVFRVADTSGTEVGFNALRQADPGAVLGEVGDSLVAVELAVAAQGTGEETEEALASEREKERWAIVKDMPQTD